MSELDGMDDMSCDEFAEVAAELALGVLTGRERAAALAHLDGCESCREQVRELTMTGEELLALLPSPNRRPASRPGSSTGSVSRRPPRSRSATAGGGQRGVTDSAPAGYWLPPRWWSPC